MQSNSILHNARARLLAILVMVSLLVTACVIGTNPEPEEVTYDGSPEVIIASPLNGDSYQEGVGINILLRVDNAGPDVARVAIQVDGQIIGEAILPNPSGDASFTVSNGWPASGEGSHTISAVASRSDGTVSLPASVTVNVIAVSDQEDTSGDTDASNDADTTAQDTSTDNSDKPTDVPAVQPTEAVPSEDTSAQEAPTDAPTPTTASTNTPAPTSTPARPMVNITTGANVRSGPGLVFNTIGSLAAGASSNILAVNPAGTWYKIEYYNGDGWVSAVVASVTGDISSLPREAGPPTPIAASPTPAATATPSSAPDLSVTNVVVGPHPFVCNQASEIRITIANSGNATAPGGAFKVEDIYNGTVGANTTGTFPELAPGANHTAVVYLTVSNNFAEAHNTRITVDQNGQIAESNESNNVRDEAPYVLATGSC